MPVPFLHTEAPNAPAPAAGGRANRAATAASSHGMIRGFADFVAQALQRLTGAGEADAVQNGIATEHVHAEAPSAAEALDDGSIVVDDEHDADALRPPAEAASDHHPHQIDIQIAEAPTAVAETPATIEGAGSGHSAEHDAVDASVILAQELASLSEAHNEAAIPASYLDDVDAAASSPAVHSADAEADPSKADSPQASPEPSTRSEDAGATETPPRLLDADAALRSDANRSAAASTKVFYEARSAAAATDAGRAPDAQPTAARPPSPEHSLIDDVSPADASDAHAEAGIDVDGADDQSAREADDVATHQQKILTEPGETESGETPPRDGIEVLSVERGNGSGLRGDAEPDQHDAPDATLVEASDPDAALALDEPQAEAASVEPPADRPEAERAAEPAEPLTFDASRSKPAADDRSARPVLQSLPRTSVSAAWLRAMMETGARLETAAGGWTSLTVSLGEGDGTMTVDARREDERVAINVAFSDPQLRATAAQNIDRLEAALKAHYQTSVDLSFAGGNDFAGGEPGDRRPSAPSSSRGTAEASTATASGRALAPGATFEWIG